MYSCQPTQDLIFLSLYICFHCTKSSIYRQSPIFFNIIRKKLIQSQPNIQSFPCIKSSQEKLTFAQSSLCLRVEFGTPNESAKCLNEKTSTGQPDPWSGALCYDHLVFRLGSTIIVKIKLCRGDIQQLDTPAFLSKKQLN